jgi:PCFT/HCP family folate transporter-like MFS transporter 1/3
MSEQDMFSSLDASSSSIHSVTAAQRRRYWCWLILEPGIFLAMLGHALSAAVITQLFLVRNCQAMFPLNATKCDMLVYKIDTQEVRKLEAVLEPRVTVLQMYKTVIESCIPVILSLFVGTWSDHHGRKPLILWPMFGYGLMYAIYAFLCVVPDLDPTYFLFASIPVAFSGALVTFVTGMCAYITDTTAAERRAFRCVFGNFCFFSYIFHIESS